MHYATLCWSVRETVLLAPGYDVSSRLLRDHFVLGMALILLVVPFLPASGVVFRVGFVLAER